MSCKAAQGKTAGTNVLTLSILAKTNAHVPPPQESAEVLLKNWADLVQELHQRMTKHTGTCWLWVETESGGSRKDRAAYVNRLSLKERSEQYHP